MSGFNIRITDNTDKVLDALDEGIQRALEAMGAQVENYAKAKCPVDTGLLRNSITHAVAGKETAISSYHATYGSNRNAKGNRVRATSQNAGSVGFGTYSGTVGSSSENAVYIGTNVEYSPYIEMGTSRSKAQPFLRPAVTDHISVLKRLAEAAIRGSFADS